MGGAAFAACFHSGLVPDERYIGCGVENFR